MKIFYNIEHILVKYNFIPQKPIKETNIDSSHWFGTSSNQAPLPNEPVAPIEEQIKKAKI